ncbi:hypothetical protein G3N56_12795 [Desulfovibrio sulfodismutans]|uniref:Secretin/TonB short N-terminal domain-containing protein n=1 Tax=Desulfolutivibrio sulfodismutans TaxID=63561 RepID=A0A7K3NQX7_9BACT|nr:hypothetical protein [Desulfolutivibrio sulfodismutans]NDY57609.1 hypothetical protein [Desulfolutivibrio sulfodismutans]QLA14076.1 hypothetical protein GD606_18300 [Desulfolutivibrio sulfodismutans DSM 3696]
MAAYTPLRRLVLLSALSLACLGAIPGPAQAASPGAGATQTAPAQLVTIDAKTMRLADILKKIHEQTGFTVVIDEKYLDTPLTLRISRLDAEAAARRLAQKLSLNNYALMMDAPHKTITLRPVGAPPPAKKPGLGEDAGNPPTGLADEDALAKGPEASVDPMDEMVIPPDEEGKGMTRREYEAAMAAASQNVDPMDEMVIPPDEEGGKGMTRREYEAAVAAANQNIDPMDVEVIPPDGEGGKGMTKREFEAAVASANQNTDSMEEMVIPPDGEGGKGMTRREFEAARAAASQAPAEQP